MDEIENVWDKNKNDEQIKEIKNAKGEIVEVIEGFKNTSQLAKEAFEELTEIQTGKKKLVMTGFPWLDDHIRGLLSGDAIILSALSGDGKSETLFRLRRNILDVSINPDADEYIWANFNLEVKMLNVVLRGVYDKFKGTKKKSEILHTEFTAEERVKVKEYYMSLQDNRQYVRQDATSALEFYELSRQMLLKNTHKKAVFLSIDHVLLLSDNDSFKAIEMLMGYINRLKLEFDNCYFIVISQLNRMILSRVAERNNQSAPNASDIFGSSSMDFVSSYNIAIFNAFRRGIDQFMKVNPERYDYLEEHFGEEDSKGKVSFNTEGKLFYKIIKTRESDVIWKDIYIETMDGFDESISKKFKPKQIEHISPKFTATNPEPSNYKDITPVFNLNDAFGVEENREDDDNSPF